MRKEEVANLIEAFVNGTANDWDWDDFISVKQAKPEIEEIRCRCAILPLEFPPPRHGEYCGEGGMAVLRTYVQKLRT